MELDKATSLVTTCIHNGNKVITFGVGGNAANAMHLAAELAGKFEQYENPYPCICLCDNPCILTAITNDFGWDVVFSRQIEGLAKNGDVVIAFSISGKGNYLENALKAAKKKMCWTILINGDPNPMWSKYCDVVLGIGSTHTPRVQEEQLRVLHQLCEQVKERLSTLEAIDREIVPRR